VRAVDRSIYGTLEVADSWYFPKIVSLREPHLGFADRASWVNEHPGDLHRIYKAVGMDPAFRQLTFLIEKRGCNIAN